MRQASPTRYHHHRDLATETHVLVSAMAALSSDPQAAYAAAMDEHRARGDQPLAMLTAEERGLEPITAALEKCDAATPLIKRRILRLCALAATSDGVLASAEMELLRAIADAIGSQIPISSTQG